MVTFADMFTYTLVLIALATLIVTITNAQEITAHQAVSGVSFKLQTCTGTTATAMAAVLTGFILSQRAAFVNSFDRAAFLLPGKERYMSKVFIGVGHGGSDAGAVGNGLKEKEVNLSIALHLREELQRHGVTVGISRTVDEDDPTSEEVKECNAFAPEYAVDIHTTPAAGKALRPITP